MGGVPLENRNEVGERGMGNLYDIMAKAKADFHRCPLDRCSEACNHVRTPIDVSGLY
mgnify:CR=1 FL=1